MAANLTRRSWFFTLAAARFASARSHISKAKVTAITDEMAATQEDAVVLAQRYRLQWVELRKAPGSTKEFASLTGPEVKQCAAGLSAAKLKVSILHVSVPQANTLAAAVALGATRIVVAKSGESAIPQFRAAFDQAKIALLTEDSPELAAARVRVDIWENRNWRMYFEKLERDNFQGDISLATTPPKADDAIRELMHFIGEL